AIRATGLLLAAMAVFAALPARLGGEIMILGEAALLGRHALAALRRDLALLVVIHRCEAAIVRVIGHGHLHSCAGLQSSSHWFAEGGRPLGRSWSEQSAPKAVPAVYRLGSRVGRAGPGRQSMRVGTAPPVSI